MKSNNFTEKQAVSNIVRYFNTVNEYNEYLESDYANLQKLIEEKISKNIFNHEARFAEKSQQLPKAPLKFGFYRSGTAKVEFTDRLQIIGYCEICKQAQVFMADLQWGNGKNVNFRERVACESCGLNNRQRFMMSFIMNQCIEKEETRFYIQEQVTHFYNVLCDKFKNVTGSEYMGDNLKSGEIVKEIRHEDCHRLSFDDDSIDMMISNDVFEHVNDINLAFSEAYRILAPGGKLIFTVPFYNQVDKTVRRAGIENGALVYYKEPQYHGNPVSNEGSLVFYDFGADIFDMVCQSGFKSIQIVCADDYALGYYARPSLFYAIK